MDTSGDTECKSQVLELLRKEYFQLVEEISSTAEAYDAAFRSLAAEREYLWRGEIPPEYELNRNIAQTSNNSVEINNSMQRYPQHVPLNTFQRAFLFATSGLAAFINPRRADLIATFGEMTVQPYFARRLKMQMLSNRTGRQILREKPRISSTTLDIQALRKLPKETVGYQYTQWLEDEHVSPDTRRAVRFVDDPEEAYVIQRYRECHDFYHAITGLPVVMEGEVAVKAFEFANLGIPMTGLAAFSEPFKLNAAEQRRLKEIYLPWAILNGLRANCLLNVYWEHELERNADDLRAELGIERPPNLRELREREKKRKIKHRKVGSKVNK